MSSEIIELIAIDHEITWNSWAVQYFFFIGISVGGLLLTLPAFVLGKGHWEKFSRIALLVALTTGLVAPVALLSDLHQPARFFQFYLHFTPDSWMSWGAFFLPLYIGALTLYSWSVFRNKHALGQPVVRVLGVITGLLALLIALYTGSEMGVLDSRILWQSNWLIPLYLLTGLSGAVGLALVLSRIFQPDQILLTHTANRALSITLLLVTLFMTIWVSAGSIGQSASGAAFQNLAMGEANFEIIILWLLTGTLLPLLFTLIKFPALAIPTGLLALLGSWMVRWVMFIGGQGLPKNGAGYYNFELSLGSEGWLGIAGSFGFWLVLITLITSLLPWQRSSSNA
ncbi:MAG: polysulfide reductase NrfD [Chromatiales bacterium]|nr:polysulfide reductase NrfD [Chromatiales bacterium]